MSSDRIPQSSADFHLNVPKEATRAMMDAMAAVEESGYHAMWTAALAAVPGAQTHPAKCEVCVCPECGSKDVSFDAATRWDEEHQRWYQTSVFDSGGCSDCGHEIKHPKWIPSDGQS